MAKQKVNSNKKSKKKNTGDKIIKKYVGKRGRLIVRNLPFNCKEENLAEVFGEFGKIIEINLPKHPDNHKPKGFGFVDFQSRLSADKATSALSGKKILGRTIYVERAVSKERFLKADNKNSLSNLKDDKDMEEEDDDDNDHETVEVKQENDESENSMENIKKEPEENAKLYEAHDFNDSAINKEGTKSSSNTKQKLSKQPYEIPKKKKARIIIRNLSFKTNEDKLRKHFSPFGDIIDLNLLRRINNKLVGCAFIEYSNRTSAVKAIVGSSGKPFLGRPIVVDWAIPVKEFKKVNRQETGTGENDDEKIKEEIFSDSESVSEKNVKIKGLSVDEMKKETLSSDEEGEFDKSVVKKEKETLEEEEDEDSEEDDEDDDKAESDESDDNEDEEEDDDDDSFDSNTKKRKLENSSEADKKPKPRFESHDVSEGRTVFIKNVPFSVTNEDLKQCVKQFGPVFYALICVDPVTEHSRGTAFVKFKNKEDAEKCLSAGTSFSLNGAVLDPHIAIERDKIKEMKDKKEDKNKDSRNLYLIKEGVVLAGTPAANGVSIADMSRRLQLEQLKTQMLKNLNMFVSRNRLIIHNLPSSYDDRKLRKLFLKYSRPNAVIQEARVMRNLKNVDGKGIGKSKEYGFVSFKEHEDALHAMRNINNNPNIFSAVKRPIVAFSIENKRILNLKQKRLERSKINNPLCSNYNPQKKKTEENENDTLNKRKRRDRMKKNWKKSKNEDASSKTNDKEQTFIGFAAKPGSTVLRSKYKLKVQAKLHHKNVNKEKKDKKRLIKMKPIKSVEKEPGEKNFKAKKRKNVGDDTHFSSLVNKYKTQLMSDSVRKKWYE